ncbi:MAG: glycosyltransferase family 4 protein [Flavobacteriaceae bacterium]|nr:glycosyltransferase family 4 protein [Flavobacteriaceae bacterium]
MKIKILHVIEEMHSGGVEQRKLLLAKYLSHLVFEQKIICSSANKHLKQLFEQANCEVFEIGNLRHPFDISIHKKALKIIKDYKPDIIHGSIFEGMTIAALDGWLYSVPVRIIEETSYPITRSKKANLLLKFYAQISHHCIAISPSVKNYLIEKTGIPEKKIRMIYNGVKTPNKISELEKNTLKSKLGIPLDALVIGSVGRMENDVKGFDRILYTFSLIQFTKTETKLLIVGGGKLLEEYKQLAKTLKIEDQVIFTDFQSDSNKYYQIMDIYLSLPRSEGFGLSVVEAMSHSLPVVVSNTGGLKDIVQHGRNGFVISYNPMEIKQYVQKLLFDRDLRNELAQNARHNYLQNFTQEIYVKKIHEIYQELKK